MLFLARYLGALAVVTTFADETNFDVVARHY